MAVGQALLLEEGLAAVTHRRVAAAAGIGRRTLYRHWPDSRALLRDVLAMTRAPSAPPRTAFDDALVAHLEAMEAALHDGPLAYILSTLFAEAAHDPAIEALRAELAEAGCAPLASLLRHAVADGVMPRDLDVDAAVASLEGPILHDAIVSRRRTGPERVRTLVDRLITAPPTRSR